MDVIPRFVAPIQDPSALPQSGEIPTVTRETLLWPGADMPAENPQPVFRAPEADIPMRALDSLSPRISEGIGRGCARRVLPYRLQDRYDRNRGPKSFEALVLDNGILRATFLPGLGGRLISLRKLSDQTEFLFNNPVFQPANLALRDAWFAGGIEWNIGQFGHAHHTCSSVFASRIPGIEGGHGLRIYDFDRLKGAFWQIDFHLPPGSNLLYAHTRIVNLWETSMELYWWTNIAVPETPGLRVLAPADESVFVSYNDASGLLAYGQAPLPGLPTIGGRDGTYPENHDFTDEFFFQCRNEAMPWQMAVASNGIGFFEASTPPLNIRKMFAWGMHQGGRRWQDYLAQAGNAYVEIQAGLAPTQQHTIPLPAHGAIAWTQAFGGIAVDPALAHHEDWPIARSAASAAVGERLLAADLLAIQSKCVKVRDEQSMTMLHSGAGWGALELLRRSRNGEPIPPASYQFPSGSINGEQLRWITLLNEDLLPPQDPAAFPGEWMIQKEWHELLDRSLSDPRGHNWFSMLHRGVMRMEDGNVDGAVEDWRESIRLQPSAWAFRNLAIAEARRGNPAAALAHHIRAWELALASKRPDPSFAIELLDALITAGQYDRAWEHYQSLPPTHRDLDAVVLLAAKTAYERDDLEFVERALRREFATIREGARELTDLWFGLQMKRLAQTRGCPPSDDLLAEVRTTHRPPPLIDFRIFEVSSI